MNEGIAGYGFGLSSDDAQKVARDFMDAEVNRHPMLAKYRYEYSGVQDARVEIIDDKVMYTVPISYQTTNPEYLDDKDHCDRPASQGVEVLVDASTGQAFDWRYSPCE